MSCNKRKKYKISHNKYKKLQEKLYSLVIDKQLSTNIDDLKEKQTHNFIVLIIILVYEKAQ